MEQQANAFTALLNNLRNALSPDLPITTFVNLALDKLLYFLYSKTPLTPNESREALTEVKACIDKLSLANPLLLAKCSNVYLGLVGTHQVPLTEKDVDDIVSWICRCLTDIPDIVYTDFLQTLNSLMKNKPSYFEIERPTLMEILTSKLEDKANVSLPQNILLWRLSCLTTLSTCAPSDCIQTIAACYFDVAFNLKINDNEQFICQVWMKVLNGIETLFAVSHEWIKPSLQHLVVAIHSAMTVGLSISPSPTLQFPAHMIIPPPSKLPAIRPFVKLKRKSKSKSKPITWLESDHHGDPKPPIETSVWISSDSEYSDSESGDGKRIKKLEAHVRHEAYNLLIHFVKIVGCRSIFDWYCALFSRLIDAVQNETYSKPRSAVFGAITALLSDSKIFLSQAQHNDSKSFTSFSEILAEQLTGLHVAVIRSMEIRSTDPLSDKQQLTALFVATGCLIKVTPYSRLRPNLFGSLISALKSFIHIKDLYIVSRTLQCLIDVVILIPWDSSASEVIATPKSQGETEPWIFRYAMSYLNEDVSGIRVFSWAVVSGLCQNHFNVIEPHILEIEKTILLDLEADKLSMVSPLKALACLLEKYSSNAAYVNRTSDLWDHLLEPGGRFLSAIQEPDKAAAAGCDCLSLIGQSKFHSLSEDKKILIITLTFGCCNSEFPVVRYAALHTLNNFLSYPQMAGEIQFVCDAKDHLIRAMKDPMLNVRVKASWAFGNLVDLLVECRDDSLLNEISTYDLLNAALVLPDTLKVKQNVLRAIGRLTLLLSADDVEDPKWQELLEKSCLTLQNHASSGALMKMRWNACYGLATMFSNEVLYEFLSPLMPNLIQTLCTVVVGCSNFKVRMSACLALRAIKKRQLYGSLYLTTWQALLDGLDNSANMPDFSEFKHQHGLQDNLCSATCHMIDLLQPSDLTAMRDLLGPRLELLSHHLRMYQERITPEQGAALLMAINRIEALVKESSHEFASDLLVAFKVSQM